MTTILNNFIYFEQTHILKQIILLLKAYFKVLLNLSYTYKTEFY